jgi:hypothetical protein
MQGLGPWPTAPRYPRSGRRRDSASMVVGWPTCATVLPTAGGGVSLRPASDTLAGFGQGVECPETAVGLGRFAMSAGRRRQLTAVREQLAGRTRRSIARLFWLRAAASRVA